MKRILTMCMSSLLICIISPPLLVRAQNAGYEDKAVFFDDWG